MKRLSCHLSVRIAVMAILLAALSVGVAGAAMAATISGDTCVNCHLGPAGGEATGAALQHSVHAGFVCLT